MPLFMENALSVTPTACHQRRPFKLTPLNRQDVLRKKTTRVPLRPKQSRVFTKLYENSHRLWKHTSSECKQRMPSTPVDMGITQAPTCCRHHWEVYQESRRHLIDAVLPYHEAPLSPPRPIAEVFQRHRSPDQLLTLVEKDRNYNCKQLPLSTILVRWRHFRKKPNHNIITLFDDLRPFGPIDNIEMTSPVSARVTFRQLDSACYAVAQRFVEASDPAIMCSWYHQSMLSKAFHIRRRHLHVAYNPFVSERI